MRKKGIIYSTNETVDKFQNGGKKDRYGRSVGDTWSGVYKGERFDAMQRGYGVDYSSSEPFKGLTNGITDMWNKFAGNPAVKRPALKDTITEEEYIASTKAPKVTTWRDMQGNQRRLGESWEATGSNGKKQTWTQQQGYVDRPDDE